MCLGSGKLWKLWAITRIGYYVHFSDCHNFFKVSCVFIRNFSSLSVIICSWTYDRSPPPTRSFPVWQATDTLQWIMQQSTNSSRAFCYNRFFQVRISQGNEYNYLGLWPALTHMICLILHCLEAHFGSMICISRNLLSSSRERLFPSTHKTFPRKESRPDCMILWSCPENHIHFVASGPSPHDQKAVLKVSDIILARVFVVVCPFRLRQSLPSSKPQFKQG